MEPTTQQPQYDNTQSSGSVNTNPGVQKLPVFRNAAVTRQKVVEILANTANGCLSELGYYPGMGMRLQELEAICAQQENDIKRMKFEQKKLFEDNVKLNTLAQTQANRLRDMGLTEIEKASRLAKLEEEVQRLTAQKKELVQGRKMQDTGGRVLELSFTELQMKHMDLLDSYRLAYAEVQRLHNQAKSQADELAATKMQLNGMIVKHSSSKSSSEPGGQSSSYPQQTGPPGQGPSQVLRSSAVAPQMVQQESQQARLQQSHHQQQQVMPHPQQVPVQQNVPRPSQTSIPIPPSHPQYNQIMSAHLSQQHRVQQQQRHSMPQTVSPAQIYFQQQGLPPGQRNPSAVYISYPVTQAGTAASPIEVSPDIPSRQPLVPLQQNTGQRVVSSHPPQIAQQQLRNVHTQQQLAGPEHRNNLIHAPNMTVAPHQLMQNNHISSQQPHNLPAPYQHILPPNPQQQQQIRRHSSSLGYTSQQRDPSRPAAYTVPLGQPSPYHPQHVPLGQPSYNTQMGPPTQLPTQVHGWNPSHRMNASPDAPPRSAPPSTSGYGPSNLPNHTMEMQPHLSHLSGGEPLRQTRSVPTTPTTGFQEASQSILSIRTPLPTSRPSSSSSSPKVYLPPPPLDESTIITSISRRSLSAGSGIPTSRPSSSSSRPSSRQQSQVETLSPPLIVPSHEIPPTQLPVVGPTFTPNQTPPNVQTVSSHIPVTEPLAEAGPTLVAPIPLKRESSTSVAELRQLSEEHAKRMRMEAEQPEVVPECLPAQPVPEPSPLAVSATPPVAFVVKGEPMDDLPIPAVPFPSEQGDGDVQMLTDEDGYIVIEEELGPDGLRLVSDCLPDVYDTVRKEDGTVENTCKLCQHRFRVQLLSEPPPPMVNATEDELERHCLEDHEKVWMQLREPSES
ncbi:hypothetical protein CVT24_004946 [Panaeolus cyanescens]|uniref:Uncharacterized protein n=1 Tax=Panaeolus cyanescens TaxID=181874 RepID=A0A409V9M3_9AGAR|nr:hypothetical protein CVT24_004946 [Panaeolus cyanescens]